MNRRKFIKNTLFTAGGAALGAGLYTWQVEPFWLEFVQRKMPIRNLPDHLRGKTLMQISDVHVGNRFDYNYLIESFRTAQKLRPDFVVYTGDYVSYENEQQFKQLDEVLASAVRGKLGTVGILGNHDYGHNWSQADVAVQISAQMEKVGIQMLRNQQIELSGLSFIGFDDYWAINFAPERVMQQYDASCANLVLCHNPDVCDLNVWNGYRGWILSGHTHGGQCKPPFLPPPILPVRNKRYTSGAFDLDDGRKLYINRAVGHSYQVRFNVRPEITVFTLTQA
ncbi:MAG: metallophosphoesterase [Bacteroidota bacterium]